MLLVINRNRIGEKKEGAFMEEKKTVLAEKGDNLGSVIKHLIDFDAQQRAVISAALDEREAKRKGLEQERVEIDKKYMLRADRALESLQIKENEKAEKEINALQNAAAKNIAELEKKAEENGDFWIEEIFKRTIGDN